MTNQIKWAAAIITSGIAILFVITAYRINKIYDKISDLKTDNNLK